MRKVYILSLLVLFLIFTGINGLCTNDVVFYSSFDGTADAQISGNDKNPRLEGSIHYIDGVQGKAVVVGGPNRII